MNKHWSNIIRALVSLSIGFLIIYLFFSKFSSDDIQTIKDAIWGANYYWAALSLVLGFIGHVSRAQRWRMLLATMNYRISLSNSLFAVLFNYLVNLGIPRAGEFARCAAIARTDGIPAEKSFGTIVNERIIDLVMLFVVGILTFLLQPQIFTSFYELHIAGSFGGFQPSIKSILFLVLAAIAGSLVIYLLYQKKKVWLKEKLLGLKEGLLSIFKLANPWQFIAHTFLIWVMYWAMIYVCFFSVVDPADLSPLAGLTVLFFGTFGFIVIQGGLGVYPIIVSWVLLLYGIAEHLGIAAGWVLWLSQTIMIIVFGLIATWFIVKRTKITELDK